MLSVAAGETDERGLSEWLEARVVEDTPRD